ncbi:sperm-associated antigen 17 [Archocentrus centrarchus]|uniref:sperm-associated antigen 17 n=1 Tax=Archocentrus centrarchus TaxID=63155 RepID=UPI0011EA08FA|nr:sperm-associated antigen 17-like [Archocentrus centrarchus]
MPPKDAKKGSDKKPSTAGGAVNQNWETGLIKAEFEEDSWRACVSVVVGRGPEKEEVIQALALAVQQPQRRLFSLLTWDDALAKIHELGNPKAKKPDDAPMFYQVTEPAKLLLDAGEEIPCDLMAKILKFHLLLIKASDQQRSDANQAEGEKAAVPDKKGKGAHTPLIPPMEKKTKLKRRGDVEPLTFKDDEPEWGPQHYILLLGFYQPHLIAGLDAIGVHVSHVIKLCLERPQNIEGQQDRDSCEGNVQRLGDSPVLDAEAVQARKLDRFWSGLRPVLDSGPPDSKLHDVVQLSYTVPDFMLDFLAQDPKTMLELGSQIFDGVASLIYDCLNVRRQYQQYRNNLKLTDVPVLGLYPDPVEVVPAVLTTPLSKKKSVQEEVATDQRTRLPPLSVDVDMCYYNSLLDLVPPEACSVPLILHCMLEQVVMSAEQSLSTLPHVAEESKPLSGPWLDHQLVSYMLQRFLPLIHTEEERHCLLNNLLTTVQNEEDKKRLVATFGARETEKKQEQSLVIRHHDERALRFRDIGVVQDFDPAEVESSMMRQAPVWELIESVAQRKDRKSRWMSIKQQLQHYCTDDNVLWPEVERFFHQSVFEAMPLTTVDQQGVLLGTPGPAQQQPSTVIPWDDPLAFAKQQLHNMRNEGSTFLTDEPGNREEYSGRVCSHLDLSDIQSCRLRSLLHWRYAEHHNAAVLPQVLQLASEEYRCLDTFRGSHNNIQYIFCHNPMSPHRQAKEFWDVALHTDVKFRDYFEHVADKISNWTREEELKRESMQDRNDSQKFDFPKDEKTVCSAKEEDSVAGFIRKDSLKAWKLEQERQKEEPKTSKKEDLPKDKQQKKQDRSSDSKKQKTSSGDKKSRPGTASSSAKPPTESTTTTAPPVDENKEVHQAEETFNGFTGYSMDGKLIHVSGCLQHLFPSDGGHISVENVSFVQGSSQLKVAVKKDGHHFYTHVNQVVVEPAKHPPQTQRNKNTEPEKDCRVTAPVEVKTVKQGSLSAVLDNKIRLSYSFYGPAGEYKVISQETKDKMPETAILNPIPSSSSTRCSKGKNVESVSSKTQATFSQIRPPESQGCEGQPAVQSSPFNSLSLSVPNGLLLQFLQEDTQGEEKGILVRQSFPLHAREKARHLQDASVSKELSRVITSQGAVIRYMRDGSTEVLFADGSVSFSQDSGPVWVSDSEVQEEISNQESEDSKEEQCIKEGVKDHSGCWLTTTPCGDRICTVGDHTHTHTYQISSHFKGYRPHHPSGDAEPGGSGGLCPEPRWVCNCRTCRRNQDHQPLSRKATDCKNTLFAARRSAAGECNPQISFSSCKRC